MAQTNANIIVPQPIYQLNPDLAAILKEEIQKEREKSSILSKSLEIERYKTQQLQQYFKTLQVSPDNFHSLTSRSQENLLHKSESMNSFLEYPESNVTRVLSPNTRRQKIERYKNKLKLYKQKVIFSRSFTGRSKVAKVKPRVNGKFIKNNSCDSFENPNN